MQRPKGPTRPAKGVFECPDSDWLSAWPNICQGLCDLWWDDGKAREPWTIKVVFSPDGVLVTINDKESKLVAFTSGDDFKDAMGKAEAALEAGSLAWRKSKW